jgi:hypothetical protein
LGLGLLKSFRSQKLVGMASTQIDETDRDCDEVVNGDAKSNALSFFRQPNSTAELQASWPTFVAANGIE